MGEIDIPFEIAKIEALKVIKMMEEPIPRRDLIRKELKELNRCYEKKQSHIERWKVERIGKLEMELLHLDYKENLLAKARQFRREQQYLMDSHLDLENNEIHRNILLGVKRIVGLIERFNKA